MAGVTPEPEEHAEPAEHTGRRELSTVLRQLAWTIHRLEPGTAGLDPLPAAELAVIKRVQERPGVTVGELAGYLGLQHSNTSAAVRALVGRGLVARTQSAADRRVTRLEPTEASLAARDLIDAAWSGTIRDAMTRLDDEQTTALDAAVDALEALDRVLRDDRQQTRR